MLTIRILNAGALRVGDLVLSVDDESLTTDEQVNANYDAEELRAEAGEVLALDGHADIGVVTVRDPYAGEQRVHVDWHFTRVWVLRSPLDV